MPPKTRYTESYKKEWDDEIAPRAAMSSWSSGSNLPTPPTTNYPFIKTDVDDLQESYGNAFHKLGKTNRNIGGDFKVTHKEVEHIQSTDYSYSTNNPGGYISSRNRGYIHANLGVFTAQPIGLDGFPNPIFSSDAELDAWGTTAISVVEPTNPLSGLAVALAELKREGLPSLPGSRTWKSRTLSAKNAGKEYLNKEFGWDPLIGDIRSFVRTTQNLERLIEEYEQNSGKKIYRKLQPPPEVTVTKQEGTSYTPMYPRMDSHMITKPRYSFIRTVTTKRWFEGCFAYYLPPFIEGGSNLERNRRLAYKLYGIGVTPEIVWELTPWSWAIDWFSNAGSFFHNLGAFANSGLVMPYGYVMEENVHRMELTMTGIRTKNSEYLGGSSTSPQNMSCHTALVTTTRRRRKATPFGFGFDLGTLTDFQLSIIAALGLSWR